MIAGKTRPVLIDTDTASDDAVALIMALRSREVRIEAITVVAGNVPLEQGSRNALYTVELCGAEVPVFAGADRPLARALETAAWFHGRDGLGDQGPLSNVALALTREPGLAANVARCVVMGGAPCCEGNVTPAAEFNIWVDPEAARIVFQSGLPIELIGWQLCRGSAVVDAEDIDELTKLGTSFADFAIRANSFAKEAYHRQTGENGIPLPDPVAMGVLLDPSLCLDASQHYIEVETESPLTRGMTIVDRLNVASDPRNRQVWSETLNKGARATVCWKLDIPRWKALLFDALR